MAMNRSLRGLHVASVGNYQKGGKSYSPYMYRREIDFHPHYSGATSSERAVDALNQDASNILSISNKIQFKEGMCFRNSPIFQQLLDDPTGTKFHDGRSSGGGGGGGGRGGGGDGSTTMSKEELEEEVEEYQEEKEGKKEKRKKKKDPSVKEVREHLRMIIQYHEREMEKSLPSIYPVLGACGEDDSDDGGGGKSGKKGGGGRVFNPVTSEVPKKKKKKSVASIKGVKKKSTSSGKKKK